MNIHRVAENLKNTISGKERYLAQLREHFEAGKDPNLGSRLATNGVIQFLEINIKELKQILADVEICQQKAIDDLLGD